MPPEEDSAESVEIIFSALPPDAHPLSETPTVSQKILGSSAQSGLFPVHSR
jgi:hypothetical protein